MAPSTRSRSITRAYRSSPAPTQVSFPARRKAIRTYGQGPSSARSLRQQTLTQIDYIQPVDPEPRLLMPAEEEERPQKRRRTMDDTPSSSFHTQTLTQLLSEKGEEDDGLLQIRDSDDEDGSEMEFPEVQQRDTHGKSRDQETDDDRATSIIPQTPSHRRIMVDLTEVPSSQSTPATPAPNKCFISPIRSPLKEKSLNAKAPPPSLETRMKRPRGLVIQDSYSSVNGSWSSDQVQSPAKIVSPAQARRWWPDIPPASVELGETMTRNHSMVEEVSDRTPTGSRRRTLTEIPDSDAELESLGPSPEKPSTLPTTPKAPGANADETRFGTLRSLREETPGADEDPCDEEESTSPPGTPTPIARRLHLDLCSQELEEMPGEMLATPEAGERGNQARSQFLTQGLESQRVPLEIIRAMGPQTDRSDVILSVHPGPAEDMVKGMKNHEFRNYKIPAQVARIWIYVTHPICELRYMANIGPAAQPGEIDGESGLGNADFNSGKSGYKFAHELLQVYQLNNPVPLQMMKENGWVGSSPQKYVYVPPAVVGQLLANLRCALFDEDPAGDNEGMSISQELEEQLRSDIIHSTQLPSEGHDAVIPSSQGPSSPEVERHSTARLDGVFTKPSLPARAQHQSQRTPTKTAATAYQAIPPSQATTASEPSSPAAHSPEKSLRRPALSSSGPSFPDYAEDEEGSHLRLAGGGPFSLVSSQPMLPDSLLVDDARLPPVILDSDDEGSDG